MIRRILAESFEDITTTRLRDKGLSLDPQTELRFIRDTDCRGTSILDWTLGYWTEFKSLYWIFGLCLNYEDIDKLLKYIRFYPLETFVMSVINRIKHDFGIKHISSEIIQDPEDQEDILRVEIYVTEKDPKQVIKMWKKISNLIRSEIDRKFKERSKEHQLKLHISVRPS